MSTSAHFGACFPPRRQDMPTRPGPGDPKIARGQVQSRVIQPGRSHRAAMLKTYGVGLTQDRHRVKQRSVLGWLVGTAQPCDRVRETCQREGQHGKPHQQPRDKGDRLGRAVAG
jgi:hypothetical protein